MDPYHNAVTMSFRQVDVDPIPNNQESYTESIDEGSALLDRLERIETKLTNLTKERHTSDNEIQSPTKENIPNSPIHNKRNTRLNNIHPDIETHSSEHDVQSCLNNEVDSNEFNDHSVMNEEDNEKDDEESFDDHGIIAMENQNMETEGRTEIENLKRKMEGETEVEGNIKMRKTEIDSSDNIQLAELLSFANVTHEPVKQ